MTFLSHAGISFVDVTNPACARNAKQTIEFMRASVALLGKKDSPPVLLPLGIPHFFLHSLLFVVLFPEYLLTGDASGSSGKKKGLEIVRRRGASPAGRPCCVFIPWQINTRWQ